MAQADVDDITRFSIRQWGAARADRYTAAIDDAFVAIIDDPRAGQHLAGHDASSWLSGRAGRHRIIYRIDGDEIFVARVLHTSMDERRHLP